MIGKGLTGGKMKFEATTICAVRHNGQAAIAGDGQVTMGDSVIMKATARKIRRLYNGRVLTGFAGTVADAFTLCDRFEEKLEAYNGNLERAAVEVAKDWRSDKAMRKLEALLIVMDENTTLLVSGTGEVIAPDDDIAAIGSGGNYALAAARALKRNAPDMTAEEIAREALQIASEICVYTNSNIITEVLDDKTALLEDSTGGVKAIADSGSAGDQADVSENKGVSNDQTL